MTEPYEGTRFCCDEFVSAVEVTFAVPVNGPVWLKPLVPLVGCVILSPLGATVSLE